VLGYRASRRILPDAHTYYASIGDPATRAQIGWVGWVKDYTSAADFLPPLFSCSGIHADPLDTLNYSRLCDRGLDERIGAAGRLQGWDPVAAQQAWAAVDRSIVDRAAAVPFANDLMLTLLSPRTGGYEFNPQWGVLLDQLWVR
jgi:peptide/nickel transport system substrate-binding protein